MILQLCYFFNTSKEKEPPRVRRLTFNSGSQSGAIRFLWCRALQPVPNDQPLTFKSSSANNLLICHFVGLDDPDRPFSSSLLLKPRMPDDRESRLCVCLGSWFRTVVRSFSHRSLATAYEVCLLLDPPGLEHPEPSYEHHQATSRTTPLSTTQSNPRQGGFVQFS